jgi:ferredoxin
MKTHLTRRTVLGRIAAAIAGLLAAPAAKASKTVTQKVLVATPAPKGYDPTKHKWVMAIDANRCIGCGFCAEACKKENHVPEGPYFRTWIERYIITKPKADSGFARGETLVDSPNGGINGFQSLPPLPLHPGMSRRRDLRRAGWRGIDRSQILHWVRLLHPGVPLRVPVP